MRLRSNKKPIKAALVVGARPNFMKAAPLIAAFKRTGFFKPLLVHTGQHYDARMSDAFFKDLSLPKPDAFLGVGSGTHAEQTANVMLAFEPWLRGARPDLVLVVGDVNSTLAAGLTARKLGIPVGHVEAGLRSFDETMPEEVNRILTDHLSEFLFTTEAAANDNLRREGIHPKKIHFVGNVMIDSLMSHARAIAASRVLETFRLPPRTYAVLTLHRPANVDEPEALMRLLRVVEDIAVRIPVIFPVHPRTAAHLARGFGKTPRANPRLVLAPPLGYIDFIKLMRDARFVMTDSGGIQEETTVLNVPCLTLRETTERPVTVREGTNTITGTDGVRVMNEVRTILSGAGKKGGVPKYWDGHAAERIVGILHTSWTSR